MRKALRWSAWGLGGLVLLAGILYLLRWPLLEGRIRREIARLASENLASEIDIDRLGGSLLSSIDAQGVRLRPRPGSPLKTAALRSVTVRGFLGGGPIRIEGRGAEIVLAPRPGPAPPPQESFRDAIPILRALRFDGRIELHEVRVELADGRRFDADGAVLDGGRASAEFRTEGFGTVRASSVQAAAGGLTLEAEATEGPVRSLKVELGARSGADEALKVTGRYKEQSVVWEGSLTDDAQGRPLRATGRLAIPQGRADMDVDLVAGRARLDIDGTLPVREPIRADVELRGRAEGPLEGPLGDWTFSEVVAKTRNAEVESLKIDYAEASCPKGTLAALPVHAGVTAGPDHAVVDGIVRWTGSLELELRGRAQAEVIEPYLRFLPKPPPLGVAAPRAEGTFRLKEGAPEFEGVVETGPGSFDGRTWESLRFAGSVSTAGVTAREVLVTGSEAAPVVTATGSIQGERVEVRLEAGPDGVTLKGRLTASGDGEGEFTIDGPCLWLQAFGEPLPAWASPLHARGKGARTGGAAQASLSLTGGAGWSAAPEISAREREGAWHLQIAAGTVTLSNGSAIRHESFAIEGRAGRVSLPDLRVSSSSPPVLARLSSRVDWDDRGTRIDLEASELEAWGIHLDALRAGVRIPAEGGTADVDVRWGKEGAPSLLVSGRLGRSSDLSLLLRVPDAGDPFVRKLAGGPVLQGSATLDVSVRGPLERPEIAGTLTIRELTTAGWSPVSLVVPVHTEEGRELRLWCDEATPYGALRIDGKIGLPWIDAKPRLDLSATLRVTDLEPLLKKVDSGVAPWIPPVRASLEGHLKGPLEAPIGWAEGTLECDGYSPPAPLGRASRLRLSARLDESGVQISSVEGRLGGGAFQGKGLWELWKEERPLAIHVTGDELLVVDDPLARLRVKPDVTLHYTGPRGLWLSGSVEVPLVIYHRELGGSDLGRGERRGAIPLEARAPRLRLIPLPAGGFRIPGIPGLEELALDLEFKTTGEFLIENGLIGLQLGAEGRIRGNGAVPAASGMVRAKPRHGEIRIGPGAFVRVESAQLMLPEAAGKEPTVRFEGRIGSGQDQITILISGPPEHASLTLVSDPPKDQRELLAVLTQKAALGTLTSQLTSGVSDDWPSATRKESFLSRITPTVIPGEAPGTRRNPWELPAVGTARGTVVRTEYVYNKYFSIIGETDREVELSGDLKFRIRF